MQPHLRSEASCSEICKIMTPCWEVGSTETSWLRKRRRVGSLERLKPAVPDVGLAHPDVNSSPLSLLPHDGSPQGPALALILLLGFVPGDSTLVTHLRCSA